MEHDRSTIFPVPDLLPLLFAQGDLIDRYCFLAKGPVLQHLYRLALRQRYRDISTLSSRFSVLNLLHEHLNGSQGKVSGITLECCQRRLHHVGPHTVTISDDREIFRRTDACVPDCFQHISGQPAPAGDHRSRESSSYRPLDLRDTPGLIHRQIDLKDIGA